MGRGYGYLIGGRKTGKREAAKFDEIEKGDPFYTYTYTKKDRGHLKKEIIVNVNRNTANNLIEIKTESNMYYVPFFKGNKSFQKYIDLEDPKLYFATTLDELENNIKERNLRLEE